MSNLQHQQKNFLTDIALFDATFEPLQALKVYRQDGLFTVVGVNEVAPDLDNPETYMHDLELIRNDVDMQEALMSGVIFLWVFVHPQMPKETMIQLFHTIGQKTPNTRQLLFGARGSTISVPIPMHALVAFLKANLQAGNRAFREIINSTGAHMYGDAPEFQQLANLLQQSPPLKNVHLCSERADASANRQDAAPLFQRNDTAILNHPDNKWEPVFQTLLTQHVPSLTTLEIDAPTTLSAATSRLVLEHIDLLLDSEFSGNAAKAPRKLRQICFTLPSLRDITLYVFSFAKYVVGEGEMLRVMVTGDALSTDSFWTKHNFSTPHLEFTLTRGNANNRYFNTRVRVHTLEFTIKLLEFHQPILAVKQMQDTVMNMLGSTTTLHGEQYHGQQWKTTGVVRDKQRDEENIYLFDSLTQYNLWNFEPEENNNTAEEWVGMMAILGKMHPYTKYVNEYSLCDRKQDYMIHELYDLLTTYPSQFVGILPLNYGEEIETPVASLRKELAEKDSALAENNNEIARLRDEIVRLQALLMARED